MFGDMGHGGLILVCGNTISSFSSYFSFTIGLLLCYYKEKLVKMKSAFAAALPYRYMIILLGFFAFYSGCLYNDLLSIPTNFWGSCYSPVDPANHHNKE